MYWGGKKNKTIHQHVYDEVNSTYNLSGFVSDDMTAYISFYMLKQPIQTKFHLRHFTHFLSNGDGDNYSRSGNPLWYHVLIQRVMYISSNDVST